MIPEVRIHNGKFVMGKARRENLITIQRLCPSITDGRGRGEPFCHGITTRSGGKDERVGGRHSEDKEDARDDVKSWGVKDAGEGMLKTTHIITKGLTLNPEAQHQNSPYCPQPFPSCFSHTRTASIVHSPSHRHSVATLVTPNPR